MTDDGGEGAGGRPIGRRVVLGMIGLGAAGILVGDRVQSVITNVMAPIQAADPTGLTQLLPAAGGFRFYTITSSFPSKSAVDYRLRVSGLVKTPLSLTLDDLKAMPPTRLVRDFQCVTGWRVPSVHWTGVLLSDVLDAAGVMPQGTALSFHSFDGADTESLTMAQGRRRDVIVAYEMLGAPVTRDHGGPVRLYVAPMYGYKSLKWLDGIEVTDHVIPGYWERHGYDVDGWIGKSNGRDDKPVADRVPARLARFDLGERVLHWLTAALMLTLLATGSALYIPPISQMVGQRQVVLAIHVYAGIAVPFPLLLTAAARRWGAAFRADARRINRWSGDDKRWLRTWGRDEKARNGKFNAGQKLNAAFTVGTIVVMLATGLIMKFPNEWPLSWRTGATFVHDWVYLAAAVAVTGHILYALNDSDSLRSMWTGWVPGAWARGHAPRWYEEETGCPASRRPDPLK